MLTIGLGRLNLGKWYATDGVSFFRIASPYLLLKIMRQANRIATTEAGQWLLFNDILLWFRKDKDMVARHIPLGERYTRRLLCNSCTCTNE